MQTSNKSEKSGFIEFSESYFLLHLSKFLIFLHNMEVNLSSQIYWKDSYVPKELPPVMAWIQIISFSFC